MNGQPQLIGETTAIETSSISPSLILSSALNLPAAVAMLQ